MADRFERDPTRLNYTVVQAGKEYQKRLLQRAQVIFSTLLKLLPSTYKSSIQGPTYTNELKAVAVEIARLELALEDVSYDASFATTRAEFLYSIVGYFLFLNGKVPTIEFSDQEFQQFLLKLLSIFYRGSLPAALKDLCELVFKRTVTFRENYLLIRQGASGLDISDQFGFQIDLNLAPSEGFPPDLFNLDKTLRQLLDILRPAHTLYRLRFVFDDKYAPNPEDGGKILDAYRWHMDMYQYEDLRRYGFGILQNDYLGFQEPIQVTLEDHSDDF